MRNCVLVVFRDLGEGFVGISIGNKYRIIAEASVSSTFKSYATFEGPFEVMRLTSKKKGHNATKARSSGRCRRSRDKCLKIKGCEFVKEFVDIVGEVFVRACIAGGIYSGSPAEGIDFKAAIVAETVYTEIFPDVGRLLKGILLETGSRFWDVNSLKDIIQAKEFIVGAEDFAGFAKFALIAGSEY